MTSAAWGEAVAAQGPAIPRFVEETGPSGLDATYSGGWQYMVGGGVATFDCNGDLKPEMLIAGGEYSARFFRNASPVGGALSFVAEDSGLELDGVTGAYPVDIDSDGVEDVILLRVDETLAMRGLGGCRFGRANEDWGFQGGDAWATALAATWERGATWPTVALGTYIDRAEEAFPWGSCTDNTLHRGGIGGFAPALALTPSYCTLSMLFTDWNRSGTPSLRVSNDREYYKGGQEQMWRVEPGARPEPYTEADGWKRLRIWGMGIASTDLQGDGYPEYYLTSMADNKLQTLAALPESGPPKPIFTDVAWAKGVTAHRPYIGEDLAPSTAWHAQFDDVNNDGLVDLFVAKGNVAKMPDFAQADPDNLLVQRADGTFLETGDKAGVASLHSGRGAGLVDLNLDGLLDLVVVNQGTPAQVFRNVTEGAGGFVAVRVERAGPNTGGVGARLEVRTDDGRVQRRDAFVGGGHASGHAGWLHVGLGGAASAEMRMVWPDGTEGPWTAIAPNTFQTVDESGVPVAFVPE